MCLVILPCAGVVVKEMLSFTVLTRLAYYHLSPEDRISPQFVLMSLKGSIVLFIFAYAVKNVDSNLRRKKKISLLERYLTLLTFLIWWDFFQWVRVFLKKSLERAIQVFCALSFISMFVCIATPEAEKVN